MKAHLQSVLRLIDKDFLPAVPEGLPGSAKSRDAQMRAAINKVRNDVKQVLNTKDALEEANLEAHTRPFAHGAERNAHSEKARAAMDEGPVPAQGHLQEGGPTRARKRR